jgi:cobalt-zinc-cadmium efflux system membrane fusion protein
MGIVLRSVARHAPTFLTFAALIGLFGWGHRTGWRLAKPVDAPYAATDAWCAEHHVGEDVCILCRRSLGAELAAKEPAHHRAPGEKPRFAQVASTDVLTRIGIGVEAVVFDRLAPRVRVAGETIYPPQSVARLSTLSDGLVREVLVQVGTTVHAGALLAVVEAADVGRAKSALMLAVTQLDLAQANAKRARITAAAGIRSQAELEDIEARLRSAGVALFDAEQALRNLGFAFATANLIGVDAATLAEKLRRLGLPEAFDDRGSANLLPLRAPRAGMVTEILAVAGEAIEAYAPLVIVADTTTLWASLPVTVEQIPLIAIGQSVAFSTEAESPVDGTVVAIAQAADPRSRLVTVWATLPNPDQRLRVGAFGNATITTGAPVASAVIPSGAIQYDGDQAYVFVRRTETIFRGLPVKILAGNGGMIAVDRLMEGDTIAVSGTSTLFSIAFLERMGAGCCAVE